MSVAQTRALRRRIKAQYPPKTGNKKSAKIAVPNSKKRKK